MARQIYEIISDNAYVILTIGGALAVVIYVWAKYNSKARSRYKS